MVQILSFPSTQDREMIQFCISSYANGKTDLSSMMRQIAHIMEQFNIKKIHMDGYTVRLVHYWDVPVVIIEGKGIHGCCPSCRADTNHARYLRTNQESTHKNYDIITVFCLECGAIYDCQAPNGRKAIW